MCYTKDLLLVRKRLLLVVLGGVLLAISILMIPVMWLDSEPITLLNWCCAAIFFLNGAVQLMHGLGFSEERLFGEAFVTIDHITLRIKTRALAKEQVASWDEVRSVALLKTGISILHTNGVVRSIPLYMLNAETLQEVKEAIAEVAEAKGIPLRTAEELVC